MRLNEIQKSEVNNEELKASILKPGVVQIADASYLLGQPALGNLQDIGAGIIRRKLSRSGEKSFGFHYFTKIQGTEELIMASIQVGTRLLKPGESFMDDDND